MTVMQTKRILFIGNSITRHRPKPEIGWMHDWGMAASSQEHDYVHILTRNIAAVTGTAPVVRIEDGGDFERHYEAYDFSRMKDVVGFGADTVIVAVGENVPVLDSECAKAMFRTCFLQLLTAVKQAGHPAIFVRSSFWADAARDAILGQVCAEVGGVFFDISGLGKDEANYARSERRYAHDGVAAHPGDKGMRAIADAIWAAMNGASAASPHGI